MNKEIEKLIKDNKILVPDEVWDSKNRRSPNILIGRIIEITAKENPSLRLSQIFSLFDIDLKNIEQSTESLDIWEKIQNSKYYQDNIDKFLQKMVKP